MPLSYKRLWKLLIEKDMSKADLRKTAKIAPNTMTKMRRNKFVSIEVLCRVCEVLDCDFGDVIEYIKPDLEENKK